jgi:ERCC4-type nuclease
MKKQIKILMDDREPKTIELKNNICNLDIVLIRKRLEVGDYIYPKLSICIERKEINDFCCSIMDNRIETQIEKMKNNYENNFIIIVGDVMKRTSEIDENCIWGKITSLIIKHNIKVIQCENDFQFLYLIKSIINKYQKEKQNEN